MSVAPLSSSARQAASDLRLNPNAVAVPALSSHVRPALVLQEREARHLLDAAKRLDVSVGGCFSAGPAGIQVWDAPWNGPGGGHGSAVHLGSVDWSYDTPVKHYCTIYRAMVTQAGVAAGETTASILSRVMALTGMEIEGHRVTLPLPPAKDPFKPGTATAPAAGSSAGAASSGSPAGPPGGFSTAGSPLAGSPTSRATALGSSAAGSTALGSTALGSTALGSTALGAGSAARPFGD